MVGFNHFNERKRLTSTVPSCIIKVDFFKWSDKELLINIEVEVEGIDFPFISNLNLLTRKADVTWLNYVYWISLLINIDVEVIDFLFIFNLNLLTEKVVVTWLYYVYWIKNPFTVSFVKTKQKRRIISTSLIILWHVCQYGFWEISSRAICRISGISQVLSSLLEYCVQNLHALILAALV